MTDCSPCGWQWMVWPIWCWLWMVVTSLTYFWALFLETSSTMCTSSKLELMATPRSSCGRTEERLELNTSQKCKNIQNAGPSSTIHSLWSHVDIFSATWWSNHWLQSDHVSLGQLGEQPLQDRWRSSCQREWMDFCHGKRFILRSRKGHIDKNLASEKVADPQNHKSMFLSEVFPSKVG